MIRKSLLTIFFLFLCSLFSWGQNIRVESFNRLDNDITARTSVVLDANDDECALIKMVTTDTNYNVDGYIKRRDDRVGELWFYVPQGTKQIVIRHKRLGKLVYPLPEVLKSKVTYQITLPDNVEIIVHEDAGGQYLVMKVEPAESTVYIDGITETLNGGVLQKFLSYGAHTYRVEAPLYQPMEGNIQIADARKDMTVSLLPDYGFVKFTSVPENGATVYMNGQELGKTPFTTGRLMKGTYTVNATLPMHAPATRQIMIEPGKTSNVTLNFSASYGTVNLTAAGADIYVNNELKGTGKWSGRLSAGLHRIEARKAGHRPGVLSLDVAAGQTQTISLPAPAPMYASLDISCNQTDAHVYIDGKDMGVAPNIFKVLSGKHTVELKNETFKSQKYEVELAEGEAKRVEGTLTERMKVYTYKNINFKTIPCASEMQSVLIANVRTHEGYFRGSSATMYVDIDNFNACAIVNFKAKTYHYSFETLKWKEIAPINQAMLSGDKKELKGYWTGRQGRNSIHLEVYSCQYNPDALKKELTRKTNSDIDYHTMPVPYKVGKTLTFIDNKRQKAYVFVDNTFYGTFNKLCIYSFETSKWEMKEINTSRNLNYFGSWDLITTEYGHSYFDFKEMNMKEFNLPCEFHGISARTIWMEGTYALVFEDIDRPFAIDEFIKFSIFDPIKRNVKKVVLPFKKKRSYQVKWTDKGLAIRTYTERKYKKGEYVYKNELWYKWDSSNEHYFTPIEDFTPNKFYDLPFVTPKSSNADVIQMSDNFFE